MTRAACTIVSLNYLPYARTLSESFFRLHEDWKFYVLIVDRLPPGTSLPAERFDVIFVEELGISDFASIAFKYDVLALNTNVKPSFMRFLLDKGVEQLIYLDPDIFVYSPLDPIVHCLEKHSIVLTPHFMSPNDADLGAELTLLIAGTYNLGFIAISSTSETRRFLDWWERRCLDMAFDEPRSGLFVDQKWVNLVPIYFRSVGVLDHAGCNVAYWNLHERSIRQDGTNWLVAGDQPLVFFHFSGIDVDGGSRISKYTEQFNLENRPELEALFQEYRERLIYHGIRDFRKTVYAFGLFDNGTMINRLTRALYAANLRKFGSEDPFSASSSFYDWAKRTHILSSKETANSYTLQSYSKKDYRLRLIHLLLRATLRVAGANNYTLLMKYLSHITILRNQKDIFGE
jgi:hypothetical protein